MLSSIRQKLEETLVRFGRSAESTAMERSDVHRSRRPSHSVRNPAIGTHDGVAKMFLSGPNVTPYFLRFGRGAAEQRKTTGETDGLIPPSHYDLHTDEWGVNESGTGTGHVDAASGRTQLLIIPVVVIDET